MLNTLFRKKRITCIRQTTLLHRSLNALDLTLLGIGAIIGAGVFILTGIAAATKAGPAVIFSYVIAGCAAMFAAFSYAELTASIGGTGSAYSYAYVGFGELIAWMIGWDLLFEYTMSVSAVAIGWSSYVNNFLMALHIYLPYQLTKNPFEGGIINLPGIFIVLFLSCLLCIGVKQSARFNAVIVIIKLITIAIFMVVATKHIHLAYWNPFFPFGLNGVIQGAALVFFAYIGFDSLSTAVDETIYPERDIPIGIIVSLVICTIIYIIVAALLTSIVPYQTLNVASPVADALLRLHHPITSAIISAGAIAGLTTVILVMYYGLTRVYLAIASDGLLPKSLTTIHPYTRTPIFIILLSGCIMSLITGFVPIDRAAELVNIGTLTAFLLVSLGCIVLRIQHPHLPRPFKLPFFPIIPILGVFFCLYLLLALPLISWIRFISWMLVGFVIYFGYSRKHSHLHALEDKPH